MTRHQCFCLFVPPIVLERLARKHEKARMSMHRSVQFRNKRNLLTNASILLSKADKPKGGEREVYDCKQTWEQRGTLVRGEKDPATQDDAANEVFDYSGVVRSWFKEVLKRDSIDGAGLGLILNVHYGVDYMNAFWDGDEMTFGDGDGEIFTSFSKSLDVVAHELGHGVTQFTAALEYYSQSGALNEHFSDVFGTAITQFASNETPEEADWLIGDEIMGPSLYGEALRSMSSPGSAYSNELLGNDPQPGHMRDYFDGPQDNRGVHINSGIPNKAFYKAAMEIGTDKATLIWYDALQKLWATAQFNDAVSVIVDSARELTKKKEVPKGSPQVIRAAFKAVGLPE
jgi:Zn-dependent metalloprotease